LRTAWGAYRSNRAARRSSNRPERLTWTGWPARGCAASVSRFCPASRPAAAPGIWASLATIPCNIAVPAAFSRPSAPTSSSGFARYPKIDTMQDVYGLKPVAIAVYPMYRGLARLVGMDIADAGSSLGDQIASLQKLWDRYDFFFLHYKYTDSTGEDGNFTAKV